MIMRKEIAQTDHKTSLKQQNVHKTDYFFSVVICTYNREKLLPRALDSLIKQKFTEFEVIVVDDGSTDRTFSVIQNYRKKLNLRYIFQQNKGISISRNVGGLSSNGEYITFLDSDDEYRQEHLQSRFKILSGNPKIDLLFGGVEVVGNSFVPDANNLDKLIELSECIIGGTFFIRRQLFKKLNGFRQLEYSDDYDFYKRAVAEKANILKVDIPTYIYFRDTEDSICNTIINKGKNKDDKKK